MEILKDFGINPILLIAQIVNFLILLFILNRILFKPLMKVLEERKQKIATSLKEAEQIAIELQEAEVKSQEIVEVGNKKADQLIIAAKDIAEKIKEEAIKQAKSEVDKIFKKGQENLGLEKEKMRASLREELQVVVVMAVEKVIGKTLSTEEKESITKTSVQEIN